MSSGILLSSLTLSVSIYDKMKNVMGVQKNFIRPFRFIFYHINHLPLFRGLPDPQVAQLVNPHNSVNSSGENPARPNRYFLPTNVFQLHRWWQHKAIIIPRRGVLLLII